jgi:hypothetical protein
VSGIDISLMTPRSGIPIPQAPLYVLNLLTNEVHGYTTVADLLNGAPFFNFSVLSPGIYEINNGTETALPVVLFRQSYTVDVSQQWIFVAHDEMVSNLAWQKFADGLAILTQTVWDTSLGGTTWDNATTIWDLGTS